MDQRQWVAVKDRFLEGVTLSLEEREALLQFLAQSDAEISDMVRHLLEADGASAPDLRRPCWDGLRREAPARSWHCGQLVAGRFEIIEFIGAGGLGEVYRAYDKQQNVKVALKTLRSELAAVGSAALNLRKELNIARQITHPNVCRVYDFHPSLTAGEPPFLTMEFLDGETLYQMLARRGPLSDPDAELMAAQLLAGLDAAHARGVVHRDLKTANIIVTEGRHAYITDFGLARDVEAGPTIESTLVGSALAGTPAYMAPEQFRGEPATFVTDIHALGIVLFELVSGRRPFEGATPIEIALERLHRDAPSPRNFKPDLSRRWEYTILRCLERDPKHRPQTVQEVAHLLRAEVPFLWKRRWVLLSLAGAPVAAAGAWLAKSEIQPIGVNIFEPQNRTGDGEAEYLCRGAAAELQRVLGQVQGCRVFRVRETSRTPKSRNGARFSYQGYLERVAGKARLTVQMVDEDTGSTIWSRSCSGEPPNAVLAEIGGLAESAADQLESQLPRGWIGRLAGRMFRPHSSSESAPQGTNNSLAFDRYLRGMNLLQEGSASAAEDAVALLSEAVSYDPHFALALAALSEASMLRMNYSYSYDVSLARDARQYAERAVRERPDLAEAHAALAASRQLDWNWVGAERSYNDALRLKPGLARALRWRGGLRLQFARFDEALADMRRSLELDPYDRAALSGYGMVLLFSGREREAVELLEAKIGDRDMVPARTILCQAYARLGSLANGESTRQAWFAKALATAGMVERIEQRSPQTVSALSTHLFGLVYALRGALGEAQPYLRRLREAAALRGGSPVWEAMVLACEGKTDAAVDAVEQAIQLRDRFVLNLRVNVFLEKVRSTPRFERALRSIGLL